MAMTQDGTYTETVMRWWRIISLVFLYSIAIYLCLLKSYPGAVVLMLAVSFPVQILLGGLFVVEVKDKYLRIGSPFMGWNEIPLRLVDFAEVFVLDKGTSTIHLLKKQSPFIARDSALGMAREFVRLRLTEEIRIVHRLGRSRCVEQLVFSSSHPHKILCLLSNFGVQTQKGDQT